ncbi:hypothetical protein [Chlorobium sp. N1]|uniref:hypothetical protein n=1 Tax=Chlorobium sp. N1 TaxID=2491138 RepID=UPI0013F15DD2|nr:hypothetical protein [Chlorobium sp. N1]
MASPVFNDSPPHQPSGNGGRVRPESPRESPDIIFAIRSAPKDLAFGIVIQP